MVLKIKIFLSFFLFCLLFSSGFAQKKSKDSNGEYQPYIHSFPAPDYLIKDKIYYLRGRKNGLEIDLELKRKSAKEIQYKLSIIFPNQQNFHEKGTVYMTFAYDMGTEEILQESTGEMESCTNFFPRKENGLTICIGQDFEKGFPVPNKLFVSAFLNRENYPAVNIEETPELFQLDYKP